MRFLQRMCFVVLASGLALGQAANNSSAGQGSVADELKALREAIGEQQKQIAQQQQQIQTLEQRLQEKTSGTPHVADATLRTASPVPATTVVQETEKPKESPLSFRIGGTEFTPGGFVDFENIFRSTNTGNVTATTFGGIPFSNTVSGTSHGIPFHRPVFALQPEGYRQVRREQRDSAIWKATSTAMMPPTFL